MKTEKYQKNRQNHCNLKSDGSRSDISAMVDNGLNICVDWLAFTITELSSVKQVMEFLGFDILQFSQAPRGAMGYKSMYKLDGYPVSVLYDGSEGMGIHVNISGSAVSYCIAAYRAKLSEKNPFDNQMAFPVDDFTLTALSRFLKDLKEIGHLTRMDLAIDDIGSGQYFTCEEIEKYLMEDRVVSKFRKFHIDKDYKMGGEVIGHTIYLGSRKSEVFLRIYDKYLEQKAKDPENTPEIPWVRWEFELKNHRADLAADMLIGGCDMGQVVLGILTNYVRIIDPDDTNRTRCSSTLKWQLFIDGMKAIRLYVPDAPKTLEDKRQWIDKQVLSTLAGLFLAYGGTFSFIEDNLEFGIRKMKYDLRELVVRANPEAAEFLLDMDNW